MIQNYRRVTNILLLKNRSIICQLYASVWTCNKTLLNIVNAILPSNVAVMIGFMIWHILGACSGIICTVAYAKSRSRPKMGGVFVVFCVSMLACSIWPLMIIFILIITKTLPTSSGNTHGTPENERRKLSLSMDIAHCLPQVVLQMEIPPNINNSCAICWELMTIEKQEIR